MIVVKAGGSRGVSLERVCADVAWWWRQGRRIALVHGGSNELNVISEQLGHAPRFVTTPSGHSSRSTDRETMEILAMVMGGRINTLLVERLQQLGVNAIGLCGSDGRLIEAKRKPTLRIVENGRTRILRSEYSGRVEHVNAELLRTLLDAGYVPVIAPFALSDENELVNIDGDRAAAAIAAALHAEALVILSNVPGLLRDVDDPSSLIEKLDAADAQGALERYAMGRMKRKLLGAIEAMRDGVQRVVLADGRVAQPLQQAWAGKGTVME